MNSFLESITSQQYSFAHHTQQKTIFECLSDVNPSIETLKNVILNHKTKVIEKILLADKSVNKGELNYSPIFNLLSVLEDFQRLLTADNKKNLFGRSLSSKKLHGIKNMIQYKQRKSKANTLSALPRDSVVEDVLASTDALPKLSLLVDDLYGTQKQIEDLFVSCFFHSSDPNPNPHSVSDFCGRIRSGSLVHDDSDKGTENDNQIKNNNNNNKQTNNNSVNSTVNNNNNYCEDETDNTNLYLSDEVFFFDPDPVDSGPFTACTSAENETNNNTNNNNKTIKNTNTKEDRTNDSNTSTDGDGNNNTNNKGIDSNNNNIDLRNKLTALRKLLATYYQQAAQIELEKSSQHFKP